MQYLEFLKKMNIIKCMGGLKEGFFDLVKYYGDMLDRGNRINDTLYTLHDFSHHCVNIFKILNDILLSDAAFSADGLTSEELFVLNTSVLFHDISMAKNIHFDRNAHSEQSALFVLEEYKNPSSLMLKWMTPQQIDAVRIIIKSHSDIKVNEEKVNALDDPELVNDMPGHTRIRARLLAGLLRLADELDVTNSRIGNDLSYYNQLEKSNNAENESIKHWKTLMCFKDIKIKNDNVSVIELVIDDLYIKNEKDDRLDIIRRIKEVKEKIALECENIMKKTILIDKKSSQYVVVRNVELKSNMKEILELPDTTINRKPKCDLQIISFSETTSSDNKAEINLIKYFEGRFLKKAYTWNVVTDAIKAYISGHMKKDCQYLVGFATHFAVAFMVGRIMNPKSGLETIPIQKTEQGIRIWDMDSDKSKEYEKLILTKEVINYNAVGVGIAISLTKNIGQKVREYIYEKKIPMKELLCCELEETSIDSIEDGSHAWQISKQISRWIDNRSNKDGLIHIFIAAPVTLAFNLGKMSLAYGKGIIYDYNYENVTQNKENEQRPKGYYPALSFIEGDWGVGV
jgi:hypothetical protein